MGEHLGRQGRDEGAGTWENTLPIVRYIMGSILSKADMAECMIQILAGMSESGM